MRENLDELLQSVPKQASVSTVGGIQKVLVDALETFPDAQSAGQAYTRALWHWYHGRQENSKRGSLSRLEDNDKAILEQLVVLQSEILVLRSEILATRTSFSPVVED